MEILKKKSYFKAWGTKRTANVKYVLRENSEPCSVIWNGGYGSLSFWILKLNSLLAALDKHLMLWGRGVLEHGPWKTVPVCHLCMFFSLQFWVLNGHSKMQFFHVTKLLGLFRSQFKVLLPKLIRLLTYEIMSKLN